jgi:hypothetical protein
MNESPIEAWDTEIVIMSTGLDEGLMLHCSCDWLYQLSSKTPLLEDVNNAAVKHWRESHGQ